MAKKQILVKIGGDIGNSKANIVSDNYYGEFDSMLVENLGNDREDSDDTIVYENKHFTIGQGKITGATAISRDMQEYKALTAYSVAKLLKDRNVDTDECEVKVHLGLGLPLADYADLKDVYKNNYCKDEEVGEQYKVRLNKKDFEYTITKVRVLPQGAILAHTRKELFADVQNVAFIIDFGSLSIDIQELGESGKVIKKNRISIENGVLKLTDDISAILKRNGLNIQDKKTIEKAIVNERISLGKKGWFDFNENEEIQVLYDSTIKELYKQVEFQLPNIAAAEKIVCIGGGAITFSKQIEKYFPNAIILDNAEKMNATAYYEFIGGKNAKY